MKEILKKLEENDLYIKPEKYMQKVKKIRFLGIVIRPNRIEMEVEKVDGVLSWPEPKNMKDVRKFLGLTNYYRRFIRDFAQAARPMNVLTRKNEKWQQEEKQQQVFDKLKQVFTTKLVLAALNLNKEFRVETDTSNYTTEGVLSIKCSDNMQRLVAFILKSLSDTKYNYKIHNKEILAVVRYLETWRHFLKGAMEKFKI